MACGTKWGSQWGDLQGSRRETRRIARTGLAPETVSDKHFSFITEEYVPRKMKEKRWLD